MVKDLSITTDEGRRGAGAVRQYVPRAMGGGGGDARVGGRIATAVAQLSGGWA
jgi:hypothetical protein